MTQKQPQRLFFSAREICSRARKQKSVVVFVCNSLEKDFSAKFDPFMDPMTRSLSLSDLGK